MTIERIIDNNYQIFKLVKNELNYTFVADGPLMQTTDVHFPLVTQNIDMFAKFIFEDHMNYLEIKSCLPRNPSCMLISFSYDIPYESALVQGNEIWRAHKLNNKEKALFEKCISQHSKDYWNDKCPPLG